MNKQDRIQAIERIIRDMDCLNAIDTAETILISPNKLATAIEEAIWVDKYETLQSMMKNEEQYQEGGVCHSTLIKLAKAISKNKDILTIKGGE